MLATWAAMSKAGVFLARRPALANCLSSISWASVNFGDIAAARPTRSYSFPPLCTVKVPQRLNDAVTSLVATSNATSSALLSRNRPAQNQQDRRHAFGADELAPTPPEAGRRRKHPRNQRSCGNFRIADERREG